MTNLDSKPKFEKLTAVKAAYWLSEAWGQPIKPNDVRLRGNWMFVRNDDDVDCVPVPCGDDLHGESWGAIPYNDSPFVQKDKAKIAELTAKLDAEYGFVDNKQQFEIGLLATGGDCAAGGMGEHPDYIPIHKEDFPIVRKYLESQFNEQMECWDSFFKTKKDFTKKYVNAIRKNSDLGNELIDRGIFHHKWHKRTHWEICELDENNYPIDVPVGATACFKGEGEE